MIGEQRLMLWGVAESSEKTGKRNRGPGRPFRKGQSGNPGGRRPIPADVKAILLAADERAARKLVEQIDDPDPNIAFRAAREVFERNHGKAVQPLSGEEGGPLVVQVVSYADGAADAE